MEGDLTLVDKHMVLCADDILWKDTPTTYIILLINTTPINST